MMPFKKFLQLSVFSIFFLNACSDVRLVKKSLETASVKSDGYFCTQAPQRSTGVTKFLFIIDKSGSNNDTDPANAKRADNIERFFNGPVDRPRKDNPGIFWGYIAFNGQSAKALINDGNQNNPVFVGVPGNVTAMQKALNYQRGSADYDVTPYKAALNLAKKAILDDVKKNPDQDGDYVLFFMSDGMPTDYSPDGMDAPAGPATFADVDELIKTSPKHVTLSTAYYGPPRPEAAEGLRIMAEHGNGKFIDTSQTDEFSIDDLLSALTERADTYYMTKLLVYNVNSAICLDNTMGADSDGDGLCDQDEVTTSRTNPQNRWSYGDGYSDYFHYIASLSHSILPPCNDRSDEDMDLLSACEEAYMFNSDPSGLNSLKGDKQNFDSDFDGFIDGIEYFMLHNKSAPLDNLNTYKSFDGEATSAGEQINQHRNPLYNDSKLPAKEMYDPKADFMGYNGLGQSCYHFTQTNLKTYHTLPVAPQNALTPLHGHGEYGNVVLVYFIEQLEKDPSKPGIYVYSYQTLSGDPAIANKLGTAAGLQVNDHIFQTYQVPEKKP